jgi:hypothetical protein
MPYLANALALGNWPGIKKLIIMICFWDRPPLPILRWQHYRNSKEDINWFRVSLYKTKSP